MAEQGLKEKTVRGVGWSAVDAFLGQGITFVVGIVLARILSPSEYGLIGICLIFTTILNGVVDSGFSNAIIRKKDATNEDYNTMFITNMVMSLLIYALLFFFAPLISRFFEQEELVALVRVTGLVLIINALSFTQTTLLTKRVDFKTKTKASLVSGIVSGVIGIAMAYLGYGVWALVAQQLSKQLLYTICLWILNKWWPNLSFSVSSFNYLWGFGWKLLVSGLLSNIWNQLYQLIVGKFYSPATLGQYTRSRQYAGIFSENITMIVQRVSYPVLAEIQDDKERMIEAYRKVIKMTMFITCICLISLGAVSEPLIYCLIGPQWHEASTYLPLICLPMTLYPLHAINLNMLQVQGRSDIYLKIEIIKKFIGLIPIFIGIYNIYWMLIASIFTGMMAFFLNSYYTGKNLGYTSWKQLKDVASSYLLAFIVAISVYFIKYISISYWCILLIQIMVGVSVFCVICEIFKPEEYIMIKELIFKSNKIKSNE